VTLIVIVSLKGKRLVSNMSSVMFAVERQVAFVLVVVKFWKDEPLQNTYKALYKPFGLVHLNRIVSF
jgi:hypothetical protein